MASRILSASFPGGWKLIADGGAVPRFKDRVILVTAQRRVSAAAYVAACEKKAQNLLVGLTACPFSTPQNYASKMDVADEEGTGSASSRAKLFASSANRWVPRKLRRYHPDGRHNDLSAEDFR